jgi:hypothetical protein
MTSNNGFGGRHRNGDRRRPAHGREQESEDGGRTGLITPPAGDPWMGGPGQDWPGGQSRPPQGNYPYPDAPSAGPMPQYGHPSGPLRQYNPPPPPSPPAPEYNHESGPMPQYRPGSGPMRQYSAPPPAPQYNHPSGPFPQYDAPLAAPAPQYNHPSGPLPQYDPPAGPMPRYEHPSGPMRQYGAPAPDYAVQYARDGVADLLDRLGKESGKLWTVDSVRLANQILSTANHQAAELRHEAQGQATASLAEAREEAAALVRQAADQAAATLAIAEQEAAEMRAAVTRLSAELGGVLSAYVTENLLSPAKPKPAIRPTARPAATPDPEPVTRPTPQPRVKPNTQPGPAVPPGARPAAKPNGRSRQYVAVRAMSVLTAALVVFALAAGTTEVSLHGFNFFVFRSAGVGQTTHSGLQENQGPGQLDAPGTHK